jgi:UDP-N-acetyl-D-glucosamine dehydrogenase
MMDKVGEAPGFARQLSTSIKDRTATIAFVGLGSAYYPGPGLGGHCIPVDPFYLTWKAREFGIHTRFIELAGEINHGMPAWVVEKIVRALNARRRSVAGSRILVLGLAYKKM